jgi:hypothetical protein
VLLGDGQQHLDADLRADGSRQRHAGHAVELRSEGGHGDVAAAAAVLKATARAMAPVNRDHVPGALLLATRAPGPRKITRSELMTCSLIATATVTTPVNTISTKIIPLYTSTVKHTMVLTLAIWHYGKQPRAGAF